MRHSSLWFATISTLLCSSMAGAAMAGTNTAEAAASVKTVTATAVLAGGCFWGVEAVFEHVKGVRSVVSGYAGGEAGTASYERVGSGRTGHAEAVQVVFDPQIVSYGEILRVFFSVAHDPTQLNRQGPDSGTQYRSAVFYVDDAQKELASRYIEQLTAARVFTRPIVTQVAPLRGFYAAESDHQDFIAHHPAYPYVVVNDLPKIRNLQRLFPESYRDWSVPSSQTSL